MRFRTRAMIMAAFAGPAIAALLMTGAGPANAAVTTPTAHASSTWVPGPGCNPYHLERWDFRGKNVVVAYLGSSTFYYDVTFNQYGSCLSGTLTDTYYPGTASGPLYGTVVRNHVSFSFAYPPGSAQGTRYYDGYVNYWGQVSGTWWDSGDHASGTWRLGYPVRSACPTWNPWWGFGQWGAGCPVPFPYWWWY